MEAYKVDVLVILIEFRFDIRDRELCCRENWFAYMVINRMSLDHLICYLFAS